MPARDELLATRASGSIPWRSGCRARLRANAQVHRTHLTRAAARLTPRLLKLRLARSSEIVVDARTARQARTRELSWQRRARSCCAPPDNCSTAFSYRGVLARGFALVRDGEGHPLRAAAAVAGGTRLEIEFSDGRVGATADGEGSLPKPTAPSRARAAAKPGGQGSLF